MYERCVVRDSCREVALEERSRASFVHIFIHIAKI